MALLYALSCNLQLSLSYLQQKTEKNKPRNRLILQRYNDDTGPTSTHIGFFLSSSWHIVKTKERACSPSQQTWNGGIQMKKIIILMTAMAFMITAVATAQAATLKCTVQKVEGTVVTMECGEQAATLSPGTKLKVRTETTKAAAIEGC